MLGPQIIKHYAVKQLKETGKQKEKNTYFEYLKCRWRHSTAHCSFTMCSWKKTFVSVTIFSPGLVVM